MLSPVGREDGDRARDRATRVSVPVRLARASSTAARMSSRLITLDTTRSPITQLGVPVSPSGRISDRLVLIAASTDALFASALTFAGSSPAVDQRLVHARLGQRPAGIERAMERVDICPARPATIA